MRNFEIDRLVADSASEVLEMMFFTCVVGDAEREPDHAVNARLEFRGTPSGSFGISLSKDTSRQMAAGFLAEEEFNISQSQADEVVCELTNMLCGSLLSRIESETCFELTHPEVAGAPENPGYSRNFALENGSLGVWLNLNESS